MPFRARMADSVPDHHRRMIPSDRQSSFMPWRLIQRRTSSALRKKPSLQRRLDAALTLLLFLIAAAVFSTWRITAESSGEASALNQVASLRMALWRIESTRLSGQRQSSVTLIDDFDHQVERLPDLVSSALANERSPFAHRISNAWQPLRSELGMAPDPYNQPQITLHLNALTERIDEVVLAIQSDLESRIHSLRLLQVGILASALALTLFIILQLHRDFFAPLKTLQRAAHAVRNGQFSVRIPSQPANELGDLSDAFNTMVERLAALYSGLEGRVEEKTRELQHTNHLLQLLYRTATRLSEQDLTQEVLLEMLVDVERELGLGPGIVCVRREEDGRAYPLATPLPESERAALCEALGCSICFGSETPGGVREYQVGGTRLVSIPLTGGGHWQGVMPFQIKPGHALIPWQTQILETLAGHVATALANARRTEERHRLAVLEERSIIARELHDSLAQSLSYLKIQVTLLQSRLNPQLSPELQSNVEEIKSGLNAAYRELRELLSTFRLSPGHTHFTEELTAIIHEASRRCGFDVVLVQRMNNLELSASEEIHLTRLIREALINIERHAHASWAQVTLEANTLRQVELRIEDDGIGWSSPLPSEGHFGLDILHERTALLGGALALDSGPRGGARITLTFVAQTPYNRA